MSQSRRILYFFILPILALLIFPLGTLTSSVVIPITVVVVGISLGYLLWRGRSMALTLAIFIQGMNVIVRLMMILPNASKNGVFQPVEVIANLIGIILSFYILLRLDRNDIRVQMID